MNRTDLEFLLAFADIEGLMNKPVTEVINLATKAINASTLDGEMASADDYIECYLYHYRLMKGYHLDAEVKTLVRYGGYDFFMACIDWDI
jgi:hypothetical protein